MKNISIIIFVSFLTIFLYIGKTSLWDPDEPRYAQAAREMLQTGDFINPRYNGKPRYDKPPLIYWTIALASFPKGEVTEFSARIPSVIFGICGAILTYLIAELFFSKEVALFSSIILTTTYGYVKAARSSTPDMCLSFFIFLSLYLFLRIYFGRGEKCINIVLFYLSLSLSVLSKGPVGIAIPSFIIFFFLLSERKISFIKELLKPYGIAFFLISVLPWFLVTDPKFLKVFFLKHNILRYTHAFAHKNPIYYYIPKLFSHLMPWSFFIPACFLNFKEEKDLRSKLLFFIIWFFSVFLFFSLSQAKRPIYILPLYPAASIIMAKSLNFRERKRLFLFPNLIFSICYIISPVLFLIFKDKFLLPVDAPFLFLLIFSSLSFFHLLLRGKRVNLLFSFSFFSILFFLIANGYVYPTIDRTYRSPKEFCQKAKSIAKGAPIYTFRFIKPSLVFYLYRKAPILEYKDEKELSQIFTKKIFLVTTKKIYDEMECRARLSPVIFGKYRKHTLVLLKIDGKAS